MQAEYYSVTYILKPGAIARAIKYRKVAKNEWKRRQLRQYVERNYGPVDHVNYYLNGVFQFQEK